MVVRNSFFAVQQVGQMKWRKHHASGGRVRARAMGMQSPRCGHKTELPEKHPKVSVTKAERGQQAAPGAWLRFLEILRLSIKIQ